MEKESAIIQIFTHRIEEVNSMVMKALDESNKMKDLCANGRYDLVVAMLLVLHGNLLIAANTLQTINEFVPLLTLKGKVDEEKIHYTQPIIR